MKFAVLDMDSLQNANGETNVGAHFMMFAVENIYSKMRIDSKDIVVMTAKELRTYCGEKLILPICAHIPQSHSVDLLFDISSDIVPVYLAVSFTYDFLTSRQVAVLKEHEPVGCRDSHTFHLLQRYEIGAYIMGCLVSTFTRKKESLGDKVIFSDVPKFAEKYVPKELFSNILFIEQEKQLSNLNELETPRSYAENIYNLFEEKAKLVVSSRFHAGVLALALGIPFILINEAYTFRYSWLRNMGNFYIRENISQINWNPPVIDYSVQKELMTCIAQHFISEAVFPICEEDLKPQVQKHIIKDGLLESKLHELTKMLEDEEWKLAKEIDYYDGAIAYIEQNWNCGQKIKYAFWGVNNNAKIIYDYICNNFKEAHLSNIYDANRKIIFNEIGSIDPSLIDEKDNEFIFVTTFVAKTSALELFNSKGIRNDRFYICEREYIKELY